METTRTERSYAREFLKSRSGVAGLAILIILLATSIYVVAGIPSSLNTKWENSKAWEGNPQAAPPVWVNYLGVDAPQTLDVNLDKFTGTSGSSSAYSSTQTFTWNNDVPPSNLVLTPNFGGAAYELDVIWTKPDGNVVQIALSFPTSGTEYDIHTAAVSQSLTKYIQSQTGTFVTVVTPNGELAALFSNDGPRLLNNSVQKGTYSVTLQILGDQTLSPSSSQVSLVGDSYGTMGTDSYGRPIDLGVLAGLPWALELGTIASVLSVVGGILWGGLAGFYGGWRDKVMSWGTLVILAVPGISFIIALSFSVQLSLLVEALVIAALSWPGFAIIARTVTLSIRSQTYIEADRAMGISSTRTFLTHVLPRLTPVTIAFTALSVSGVIIFAETLAFLGIEPGNVITWGGILNEAITADSSLHGWWWWTLFPGIMILVASLPFVLIGFAVDRIVAPRVSAK
ncbi:MAG: ABC transporter permease [Nitrososphaerota archaeon]|nr:ABC transporter permease [Nitrososphaerota archaeon]